MANIKPKILRKEKRDISGISDIIFKNVFNDPELLVGYINAICGVNINVCDVEYTPVELKYNLTTRGVRFDVCAKANGSDSVLYHIDFEGQSKQQSKDIHDNRKIFYASQLFSKCFNEGEIFDKQAYVREIFFIKTANSAFSGSPIKKIMYYDKINDEEYKHVEIYEIYIEELIKQKALIEKDKYAKIVLELVEVLVSKDVEEYTKSKNPLTKKVAEKIMSYTQEEIKAMEDQMDKENRENIRLLARQIMNGEISDSEMRKLAAEYQRPILYDLFNYLNEGKAEGKAEGAKAQLEENVKGMYKNGISKDLISKCVNISLEEVEQILNK